MLVIKAMTAVPHKMTFKSGDRVHVRNFADEINRARDSPLTNTFHQNLIKYILKK